MKEIKFRLIKDGKIVGYEKWHSGGENIGEHVTKPNWIYSLDNKAWGLIYIEHDTKEQSTGIHDKNGKEIFEGDIVQLENTTSVMYRRKIVFEKGAFGYRGLVNELVVLGWPRGNCVSSKSWEIIGTIHDTPKCNYYRTPNKEQE
jgi:hypothetical protein